MRISDWSSDVCSSDLGKRLVLPGPGHDPASLFELMEREAVTTAAGVPTIWTGLLAYLRETGARLTHTRRLLVAGSAVPTSLIRAFRDEYDVTLHPALGMTETHPPAPVGATVPARTQGHQAPPPPLPPPGRSLLRR